ncbi:cylicin-1 [Sabethes cyaneus]|uniref:cylicin-1 n=1 Tax=Sabethes cyaneus TaxID=53552 RepID=UPI00237E0CAF|nr:cylicin-1 [Sabethes cyaneus]
MRKENLKRKGTENGGENEENDASTTDVEKQDDEQETTTNGKENGDSKKGSASDDDFEDAETGDKDGDENQKDDTNENGDDNGEDKDEDADSEPLAKKSKKSDASGKRGKKPAKAAKTAVKTKAAKKAKAEENDKQEDEKDDDEEEEYEVQDIVDHRKERGGKILYRIRWKNYGESDDTWEPEDTLSCPDIIKKYKAKMGKEETTPAKKAKPAPKKGSAKKGVKKPTPKKPAKVAKADDDEDDEEDDGKEYEVEKIIDVHFKRDGKREYLVRWKGFSSKDDTWEPADNLNCAHLIEKFNEKLDKSKNASVKELRVSRKPTERLALSLGGRKNSRRNAARTRVTYYDGE